MARTLEEIRRAKREHMAMKRADNPDLVREKQREWHRKNREKNCQKMRKYYARRFFWGRAMKLRGENRATALDLAKKWKSQKGMCALTGRKLGRDAHLDHIIARAKGGTDSSANLRWLCPDVNYAKRYLTDEELISLCRDVSRWIGGRIERVESLLNGDNN